jgi:hypothetical protein
MPKYLCDDPRVTGQRWDQDTGKYKYQEPTHFIDRNGDIVPYFGAPGDITPYCGAAEEPAAPPVDNRQGVKYDTDKPRPDLLDPTAILAMAQVMEHGAKKYATDNWKRVSEPQRRYYAAALRHLLAWWGGEANDPESGLSHLAHAACCVMFLQHFEGQREKTP